jgi:hypothetical protein
MKTKRNMSDGSLPLLPDSFSVSPVHQFAHIHLDVLFLDAAQWDMLNCNLNLASQSSLQMYLLIEFQYAISCFTKSLRQKVQNKIQRSRWPRFWTSPYNASPPKCSFKFSAVIFGHDGTSNMLILKQQTAHRVSCTGTLRPILGRWDGRGGPTLLRCNFACGTREVADTECENERSFEAKNQRHFSDCGSIFSFRLWQELWDKCREMNGSCIAQHWKHR